MIVWFRRSWPILVVAGGCGLYLSQSGASTATKVVIGVVCMVGLLLWKAVRNLRLHTTVNRLAALGQPDAMLDIIEPELASSASAAVRLPFSVYKATALALRGNWAEALDLLERVKPEGVRGAPGRTWRFLHANQRMICLCFVGRVDEAEAVLTDELEPFAVAVRSPATQVIVDEARARLAFFKERHDESKERFSALLEDERLVPSSRASYHYFLARIAELSGSPDDQASAAKHRERAAKLAPATFMGTPRPTQED